MNFLNSVQDGKDLSLSSLHGKVLWAVPWDYREYSWLVQLKKFVF